MTGWMMLPFAYIVALISLVSFVVIKMDEIQMDNA
jgi:hypothetical protein